MVHLHNGILHSREKEGAYTLCKGTIGFDKAPTCVTDKRKGLSPASPWADFFAFHSPASLSVNRSLAFSFPSICRTSRAWVEHLKATRVLAARRHLWKDKLQWGPGQNTRFPANHKQISTQWDAHCKTFTVPSPMAQSLPRFRLGEESKQRLSLFISYCSEVFMNVSASCQAPKAGSEGEDRVKAKLKLVYFF